MTKQIQTNFRTSPEMKTRIETAAKANETTFNKEVNRRLAESFDPTPAFVAQQFFDQKTYAVMRLIAVAMHNAGDESRFLLNNRREKDACSAHWLDDAIAYDQAVAAAQLLMDALRPSSDAYPNPNDAWLSEAITNRLFGHGAGGVLLQQIINAKSQAANSATHELEGQLGEAIIERLRQFAQKRVSGQKKTRREKKS